MIRGEAGSMLAVPSLPLDTTEAIVIAASASTIYPVVCCDMLTMHDVFVNVIDAACVVVPRNKQSNWNVRRCLLFPNKRLSFSSPFVLILVQEVGRMKEKGPKDLSRLLLGDVSGIVI